MRTITSPRLVILMMLAVRMAWLPSALAQAATPSTDCVAVAGPDEGTKPDSARPATTPTPRADTAHASVRLLASVEASEVTFAREPKICVRLNGDARLDSVHVVGRRNITSPVVSGTTYRNVYVAVEILGHLNAECIAARITRSAGGGAGNQPCAGLDLRDSSSVARPSGARPP
jgi:hypothetical protein